MLFNDVLMTFTISTFLKNVYYAIGPFVATLDHSTMCYFPSTSYEANVPLEATCAMFFSDGQCNHEETGTGCCKSETRFWASRFHSIIY